jgi:hypothetical protein
MKLPLTRQAEQAIRNHLAIVKASVHAGVQRAAKDAHEEHVDARCVKIYLDGLEAREHRYWAVAGLLAGLAFAVIGPDCVELLSGPIRTCIGASAGCAAAACVVLAWVRR